MKSIYSFTKKLLIVLSIVGFSAQSMAAVTRGCTWNLSVNNSLKMQGTASATAGTVFIARKDASEKAIACFNKGTTTPNTAAYCSDVFGWNKPLMNFFPAARGKHEFKIMVTGDNGCSASKLYYVWRL